MKSIVGKILYDRYRIVQQLSQNDWSTLYLAEDLASNHPVQCKIEQLEPQYNHEILGSQSWQQVRQTFEAQGNMIKNVSQHPQIPQLLAFFECDREFYLVREHLDGTTLQQKLDRGSLDEEDAIDWLQEILRILEFVHQQGIAHLNIQPASLIQHPDGRKFLTDFAAVKNAVLGDRQGLITSINPDFSPQQQVSDFDSDIYSLGKTIIYALTGKIADSIQIQAEHSAPKLTTLTETVQAKISPELAAVLNKMLATHSEQCYKSASEVLGELDFERNVVTFPPPFASSRFAPSSVSKPSFKGGNATPGSKSFPKTIWLLLSLPFVVALVILFVGLNKNNDRTIREGNLGKESLNLLEYSNSEYQFALKYPGTWSKQQIDDPITGEIVVFASPKETDADLFAEKVHIAVEYLPSEPTTLEEYSQIVLARIEETDKSKIEQYEKIKTKIDDTPARTVIYSRQQGSLRLKQMEAFTIKNNRVYIAIYTAESAEFAQFYPTVEKMIDSWEIQ